MNSTAQRIEAADDAGAAAERDDGDAALPRSSRRIVGDLVVVAGQQHRVGRVLDSGVLAAQQVEGGLAARAQQPARSSTPQCSAPTIVGQRVAVGGRQRRRPQPDLVGLEFGAASRPDAERLLRAAIRIPSESGLAAAGHPMHSTSSGEQASRSCVTVLHMLSISNDIGRPDLGDRILDAAASCVLAYGVDRVTLAEIARRAGVSRPTIYRRWPDTPRVLAALLTARITGVLRDVPSHGARPRSAGRADRRRSPNGCATTSVVMSVLHSAPELADGLHRRAPRHQPADPHRRGRRRAERRLSATAACGRATRGSSPRCAC